MADEGVALGGGCAEEEGRDWGKRVDGRRDIEGPRVERAAGGKGGNEGESWLGDGGVGFRELGVGLLDEVVQGLFEDVSKAFNL